MSSVVRLEDVPPVSVEFNLNQRTYERPPEINPETHRRVGWDNYVAHDTEPLMQQVWIVDDEERGWRVGVVDPFGPPPAEQRRETHNWKKEGF